jgi:hypothetical protein
MSTVFARIPAQFGNGSIELRAVEGEDGVGAALAFNGYATEAEIASARSLAKEAGFGHEAWMHYVVGGAELTAGYSRAVTFWREPIPGSLPVRTLNPGRALPLGY